MGDGGTAECASGCGYKTPDLMWGAGMRSRAILLKCRTCGALDSVSEMVDWEEEIAAILLGGDPSESLPAIPPCSECGAIGLVPVLDPPRDAASHASDVVPDAACPRCGAALRWVAWMDWD